MLTHECVLSYLPIESWLAFNDLMWIFRDVSRILNYDLEIILKNLTGLIALFNFSRNPGNKRKKVSRISPGSKKRITHHPDQLRLINTRLPVIWFLSRRRLFRQRQSLFRISIANHLRSHRSILSMAFNLAPFSDLSNALFKNFRFFCKIGNLWEEHPRQPRTTIPKSSRTSFNQIFQSSHRLSPAIVACCLI